MSTTDNQTPEKDQAPAAQQAPQTQQISQAPQAPQASQALQTSQAPDPLRPAIAHQSTKIDQPSQQWDESRLVVALIGFCLILEAAMVYYQTGTQQAVVIAVTGVAGVVLLLTGWFVPFEIEDYQIDVERQEPETPTVQSQPTTTTSPEIAQTTEKTAIPEANAIPETIATAPETVSTEPAAPKREHDGVAVAPSRELPTADRGEPDATPVIDADVIVAKTADVSGSDAAIATAAMQEEEEEEEPVSWTQRLRMGLAKTRDNLLGKLKRLVVGKTVIDKDLLEEMEGTLFEADMGVTITTELLDFLHQKVEQDDIKDPQQIYRLLHEQLRGRLLRYSPQLQLADEGLSVILVIGVNGVGKTTTIAKLARKFKKDGKTVVLAAGDTFRAAAIDQLVIWGERTGVEVIRGQEGGDPGALVFDAIHAARKRSADILLIDTAGRMHVKTNLMAELKKVRKIIEKESSGPHETLLVLDATTGQNAVQQAKLFHEAIPVSGLVLTKLDGTAKGGVLLAVEEQISAPVKFIGVGEKMDDLMPFDPEEFLKALFSEDQEKSKKSDYQVL